MDLNLNDLSSLPKEEVLYRQTTGEKWWARWVQTWVAHSQRVYSPSPLYSNTPQFAT